MLNVCFPSYEVLEQAELIYGGKENQDSSCPQRLGQGLTGGARGNFWGIVIFCVYSGV